MSIAQPSTGAPGERRVAVLAVGTFAVGTDAFIIAGLLDDVSGSLRVSVAEAGQLVTVFALAYALLSPLLAALTGTWSRRRVLLTALAVFVLANVLTAIAPSFGLVLATRVIAAAGATLVTPTSSVVAAALVPPERRARAIAVATSGLTVSIAVGAPLGTAAAAAIGWRGSMLLVALLGLVALVAVAVWLPQVPNPPASSLRRRLAPVADPQVLGILLTTLFVFVGIYILYTYISVIFAPATGGSSGLLAALLCTFGVAATAGNLLAGRIADRIGARAVVACAVTAVVAVALLATPAAMAWPTAVLLTAFFGLTGFSINAPQQYRLISTRPDSAALVIAINASFIYLAVSVAGGLGGVIIEKVGGAWLGPTAAVALALGLATSEFAHRRHRRAELANPAPGSEGPPSTVTADQDGQDEQDTGER